MSDSQLVCNGLLVVEFGEAASLCGRILADSGATVVVVKQDEDSDIQRSTAKDSKDYKLQFYNGGKKYLHASELSEQLYLMLLGAADIVLDGSSRVTGTLIDPVEFSRINSRGLLLTVRPFGLEGPYASRPGTNLTAFASGGIMYVSGKPEGPPVIGPGQLAFDIAALEGAVGILVALYERETSGRGQHISVSAQEALASLEHQITRTSFEGVAPPRRGSKHESVVPARIYKCADGWIQMFIITARVEAWKQFWKWLGSPVELAGSEWSNMSYRRQHSATLDQVIELCVISRTKGELSESALALHIPCYPVNTVKEYLSDPQTVFRELFWSFSEPSPSPEIQLRLPPKCEPDLFVPQSPIFERLTAGELSEILSSRRQEGTGISQADTNNQVVGVLPLRGVRVVDMTQAVAGPFSTRFLADFGADVVKLESPSRPDGFRTRDGEVGKFTTSRIFADLNRNKRGMAFDLKNESEYKEAKEIIKNAHVLVENFAPGVLERLGLSWEVLHSLNPGLIVVRLSGLGQSGPKREAPAWGLNMQAFCGMTYLWNLSDDSEPTGTQTSISDYLLGFWGTISALLSLLAIRTGIFPEGIMIDIAQAEAGAVSIGEFTEASGYGDDCKPKGNIQGLSAPMGVYRLKGADRWCALEIRSDKDWREFSSALNFSSWFPGIEEWSRETRLENIAQIDTIISSVLGEIGWDEIPDELKLKVPMSLVHDGMDLLHCPQLNECGFIVDIPQEGLEDIRYPGIVIKLSATPARISRRSPLLGEHTTEVKKEWIRSE